MYSNAICPRIGGDTSVCMDVGLSLTSDGSDDDSDNVLYQANLATSGDSTRLPSTRPHTGRAHKTRAHSTGAPAGDVHENGRQTAT